MNNRVHEILTDLERVQRSLRAVSDDIWLGIDHNNPAALTAGVAFKQAYNDKMAAFDHLTDEIASLLKDAPPQAPATSPAIRPSYVFASVSRSAPTNRALTDQEHTLDEDGTRRSPHAVRIRDKKYDCPNWRMLYMTVCRYLYERDAERFTRVLKDHRFRRRDGIGYFVRDQHELVFSAEIANGIYAEVNLSAKQIQHFIRQLLDFYDLSPKDVGIYWDMGLRSRRTTRR